MIVPKSEAKQGSVVHFSDDEALYPEIYNFSQYTTSIARVHWNRGLSSASSSSSSRTRTKDYLCKQRTCKYPIYRPQHVFSVSKTICLPGGDFSLCC